MPLFLRSHPACSFGGPLTTPSSPVSSVTSISPSLTGIGLTAFVVLGAALEQQLADLLGFRARVFPFGCGDRAHDFGSALGFKQRFRFVGDAVEVGVRARPRIPFVVPVVLGRCMRAALAGVAAGVLRVLLTFHRHLLRGNAAAHFRLHRVGGGGECRARQSTEGHHADDQPAHVDAQRFFPFPRSLARRRRIVGTSPRDRRTSPRSPLPKVSIPAPRERQTENRPRTTSSASSF